MHCPCCEEEVKATWKSCPKCQESLEGCRKCPECGALLKSDWVACPACVRAPTPTSTPQVSVGLKDSVVKELHATQTTHHHHYYAANNTDQGKDFHAKARLDSPPRWITVCSQGLGDFQTLAEALQTANDGDRIYVLPGIYRESAILVDKSVEIAGQGTVDEEVVFESEEDILKIQADGVTIRGLFFRTLAARRFAVRANSSLGTISACSFLGPEGTGLLIEGASRLLVEGCSFENCRLGVRIEDARPAILASKFTANTTGLLVRSGCDCVVENNDFVENEGASIEIQADTSARVSRNRFRGGAAGVVAHQTSRGSIEHNHFSGHSERSGIHFPDGVTEAVVRLNNFE